MDCRVRLSHLLVLALLNVTYLLYLYYDDLMEFYETKQANEGTTTIQSTLVTIGLGSDGNAEQTGSVNPSPEEVVTRRPKTTRIHKPPIKVASRPRTNPPNAFLTRSVYTPGHVLSVPEQCPELGEKLRLLIVVSSAAEYSEKRMAVRLTWGHYSLRKDIAILFCVGTTSNPEVAAEILSEEETYGDIIQGNFVDSYYNMTLKTISILEWIDTYCPRVQFAFKTDDDMFINVPNLLSLIDMNEKSRWTIYGRLAVGWIPQRDNRSEYFIPVDQFPDTVLPNFVTGGGYLMSRDILHDLYENSLDFPYIKLEDVYITGTVAQSLNIKRVGVRAILNEHIPLNICNVRHIITIHDIKFHEQFDLWTGLLDGQELSRCP